MLLRELILKHDFEDVFEDFIDLFPDQIDNETGYKKAYDELKDLSANAEYIKKDGIMKVTKEKDFEDEEFYDAYIEKDKNDIRYAFEYSTWKENLNYECEVGDMAETLFLACVLYELTFIGYTEEEVNTEIKNFNNIVDTAITEIDNGTAKLVKFNSLDYDKNKQISHSNCPVSHVVNCESECESYGFCHQ